MSVNNYFNKQYTLNTKRLLMRPLTINDIDHLSSIAFNNEIWRYYPFSLNSRVELNKYIRNYIIERQNKKRFPFILKSQEEEKIVGISTIYNITNSEIEIGGTWIGKPYQRMRFNYESKFLLIELCFEYMRQKRVIFHTDSENYKSLKLLESIGASFFYKKESKHINEYGLNRMSFYYKIEKENWKTIKIAKFNDLSFNLNIQLNE